MTWLWLITATCESSGRAIGQSRVQRLHPGGNPVCIAEHMCHPSSKTVIKTQVEIIDVSLVLRTSCGRHAPAQRRVCFQTAAAASVADFLARDFNLPLPTHSSVNRRVVARGARIDARSSHSDALALMSASTQAAPKPAEMLLGLTVGNGWRVKEKLAAPPGATGGNFSVGYVVENGRQQAFLKALDYSRALRAPDPARALQALTEAYNFERDVLGRCRGMSRVVAAIADGSVAVQVNGNAEVVQYLILEKADDDARAFLNKSSSFDLAWSLRALHHVSLGLQQMHQRQMAHQDLKPSNILVFGRGSSKIGDVGRAWHKGVAAPHEAITCAGDPAYAPPELLYDHLEPDSNARRTGCDCYLLGSMVLFFFTNVAATPAILAHMQPSHFPRIWSDSYARVLPFVRDAFDEVAEAFEAALLPPLDKELSAIFRQLCDPDPKLRGHPADHASVGNSYSLQRYVGKFDTLARKAEHKLIS